MTEGELYQAVRKRLKDRIVELFRYPGMYAYTREAYLAQLGMALDLLGIKGQRLYEIWRRGSGYDNLHEQLDSDFIEKTKAHFEKMISERIQELKNEKA